MKQQPSSLNCFVCGVDNKFGLHAMFSNESSGEVVAHYTVPDHYQGYPGVVHGGIVASLLDEVTGRAFMSEDPPRFMFTVKLSVRYRKPVPIGQPLIIKGYAGANHGKVAEGRGEIFDTEGLLLAEAEGVFADIPEEVLASMDEEKIGWKVYPAEEVS